jgi:subfamily B ATP-binding cassette protein MsbA
VVFDLRNQLFSKMIRDRGLAYFEKSRIGGLMSYYNNDIITLRSAITGEGMDLVRESCIMLYSIGYMLSKDWALTLMVFIFGPLVALAVKKLGRRIKRAGARVLEQLQEFSSILQETLSGVRQVKSFGREDYEIGRFEEQTSRNFEATMRANRAQAILTPVVEFMATVGVVTIIWYGGREVIAGQLSVGSFTAFMAAAINISNPIKRISRAYGKIQDAQAATERVFGVMDFEPEVRDEPEAVALPPVKGLVRFDHAHFAYSPDDPPAVIDFDFTVQPGQMVALVGPSGAGKTTLANLLMRFYDATSGAILIDGLSVRRVTQRSLREQVGIVPQETMLFSGTIWENIRYGRLEATPEEIRAAAQAAHVTKFVTEMPEGFQTIVGERGVSLSGGQKQRVAIARAILKDPRILILDEATSALDTESELLVQQALEILLPGRTSFVIAHRLSTIIKADVILVLEQGRLREHGNHQELLDRGGLYAKLYHTQFRDDLGE